MRDPQAVDRALQDVDAVYHFASAVGVGQSMYQIDAVHRRQQPRHGCTARRTAAPSGAGKLIVASSMSVLRRRRVPHARRAAGQSRAPFSRTTAGGLSWEVAGNDGRPLIAVPTREDKQFSPQSVYALSKLDQETMCLLFGRAYKVPVAALRFFNVYGARAGALEPVHRRARHLRRPLSERARPPIVFEDGRQRRDFVHVRDLARACWLSARMPTEPRDVADEHRQRPSRTRSSKLRNRLARVLGKRVYRATGFREVIARATFATASPTSHALSEILGLPAPTSIWRAGWTISPALARAADRPSSASAAADEAANAGLRVARGLVA